MNDPLPNNNDEPIEEVEPYVVKRLSLKPGDVLVVKTIAGIHLSQANHERIFQSLKNVFPENRILILDGLIDLYAGIELEGPAHG